MHTHIPLVTYPHTPLHLINLNTNCLYTYKHIALPHWIGQARTHAYHTHTRTPWPIHLPPSPSVGKHLMHPTSPPPPHTNKPTHSSIHMHTHTHAHTLRPTWKKDIPRATPPIGPMLPLMKSTTHLWQPWNSYYTSRLLYTFFTSIMNNIHFSKSSQDKQSAFSFLKKNKN